MDRAPSAAGGAAGAAAAIAMCRQGVPRRAPPAAVCVCTQRVQYLNFEGPESSQALFSVGAQAFCSVCLSYGLRFGCSHLTSLLSPLFYHLSHLASEMEGILPPRQYLALHSFL